MNKLFLTEQFNDSISGVAYKTIQQKKRLLAYFAEHGPTSIGDLRQALHLCWGRRSPNFHAHCTD